MDKWKQNVSNTNGSVSVFSCLIYNTLFIKLLKLWKYIVLEGRIICYLWMFSSLAGEFLFSKKHRISI